MDVEVDRLSSLPNDLIYKILSYVDIVYSIRLSALSSRWRFIWTSMPDLNFNGLEVCRSSPYHEFVEFVNNVLSRRNNKIDVSSVSFNMIAIDGTRSSVERILEYAFSHNVQNLTIACDDPHQIPPSLFNSKSLKHLTMISTTIDWHSYPPWNFPALTTLHLQYVTLYNCSSILAMCQNLKNLTLERCHVTESEPSNGFTINNSRLLNLTLKKVSWYVDFVLVDTPQLKNLIFVGTLQKDNSSYIQEENNRVLSGGLAISACELNYLRIKGPYIPKISLDGFLEILDLCIYSLDETYTLACSLNMYIYSPHKTDVHEICDLFHRLHGVKSLVLSLEVVELLSSSVEVISNQPSPFASLKSLKISPFIEGLKYHPYIQEQAATEINLSTEVKNYLLDRSPNATFTMVSHEEASAIKVTRKVHRLMEQLRKYLQETEAYIGSRMTDRMMTISGDDSLGRNFELAKIRPRCSTHFILETLHEIKELLTKVLTSKRVVMQAYFSRLCAEAQSAVNMIIVDMKNRCDIELSIFNGYFNEFNLS